MLAASLALFTFTAIATPDRAPVYEQERRETDVELTRWHQPTVIERVRSFGKKYAVFHADPQSLGDGVVLLLEAVAIGEEDARWRCVAIEDVAECLGQPVKVRYLQGDEGVRLVIRAIPLDSPEGHALVQEASWKNVVAER